MPIFRVQMPDGRIARIDAATGEAALVFAKKAPSSKLDAAAKKRASQAPAWANALGQGATLGFADEVDSREAQLATAAKNLLTTMQGKRPDYTSQQMYDATMGAYKRQRQDLEAAHPVANLALNVGGSFLTPGIGELMDFVKGVPGITGLLQGTNLGARAIRSGVAGAGLGAVAGVGGADDGHRGEGASSGGFLGGVMGGAIPVGGEAGSAVIKAGTRLANRVSGGSLLDPAKEAGTRIAEALRKDGLHPDQVRAALNAWLKTGASSPALLDLAGPNTLRLLRAAAAKGGPANVSATKHLDDVAANLQDRTIERTRKLTNEPRPATVYADHLENKQQDLARVQYAPEYAKPVKVDPQTRLALAGAPGKSVIAKTRSALEERAPTDPAAAQQLVELERMAGGDFDQPVSAGVLDSLRINMGERGRKLVEKGSKYQAGGAFGRADLVDASLDQIPAIQPARATYKGMQAQRDALDLGHESPFSNPDQYASDLAALKAKATAPGNAHPVSADDIQGAAGVGVRSNIERSIGAPAEGSTGYLNKLSTGRNPQRVLEETFGPETAGDYTTAIGHEVDKLKNARFIDPGNGSQTALRLEDSGLVDIPHPTAAGLTRYALTKLMQGLTLTDEERLAIVDLAKSGAGDALDHLHFDRIAPQSHRALPLAAQAGRGAQ